MNFKPNTPLAGCLMSLLVTFTAQAAPKFDGNPDNLPPGRLKTQIEKLPYPAQQRALEWLEQFNIPDQDFEFLRTDQDGAIFYEDTVLPEHTADDTTDKVGEPLAVAPEDTFFLHSRPGAGKVVFLDFDGHVISGTAWEGGATFHARPYDTDGSPASFSDTERGRIAEIWHRIAEDMAPFDIDVTTEDPGAFGPNVGHVLITEDTDEFGTPMPASGAGGVAYVGVWGRSNYEYYSPALVYANNLGKVASYIAEAATHEFGHNLGLSHDGTSTQGYYGGHGTGYVSWGPIMGVGYYAQVTQWSQGEYSDANNTQDDIQIIGNKLAMRTDDHGNDLASATPLVADAGGNIQSTSPEIDPGNLMPANKGVIETRTDRDLFWFETGAGNVSLTVTPGWDSFYNDNRRGANLDIQASLYDAQGNLVASADPLNDTMAQLDQSLAAGRYYLEITGVGNSVTPYSDYGSLGMYFISGGLVPAQGDTTAPTPNPAGWWATPPTAQGTTQIDMAANPATDDSGVVQYNFLCVAGGSGCSNSGWQDGTSFSATGLQAGTGYSFQVKARDAAGNETALSATRSATTESTTEINQAPVAVDDSASVQLNSVLTIDVLANDSDPDNDTLTIVEYSQGNKGSVALIDNQLVYSSGNKRGGDTVTYTISDGDLTATATLNISISPKGQSDGGDGGDGGDTGGGNGKCHPKKGC
ncbi:Ig-like domain-containing protein [Oceanimonas sp. CHS3-5]|uniref:Ig-like domain-containing protein n=1 Tax=Oceanimonas sp. CHS3-5 TaxID=3068186 RepID=UPI00273F9ED1|nr:Ig-like domain-containing protein [Oceanimonas sp. CHS3-5]MDP5293281.1 Ig-like domain-containing protein [Oceanimonas sp. CHS3-5]